MTLSIGFDFRIGHGTGTAAVVAGPTVQIARSPTSIALSSGSPTANITFTAKDANGVATGARVYGVSSDPTITTILPDAPWTATKVANGSAVLYGQLTDPGAEPAYTGAGGQTVILNTDLSDYGTATELGARPYPVSGPDGPTRMVPNYSPATTGSTPVDTTRNIVVTDSGTKWLRHAYTGTGGESSNWVLYPQLALDAVRTYGCTFTQRWNLTTGTPQVKNFEAMGQTSSLDNNGRLQVGGGPDGSGNMIWGLHDQAFTVDTNELANPFAAKLQDIADGLEHAISVKWRWHDRSPGTVDRLVNTIIPITQQTFNTSQAGVLANGNRILLMDNAGTSAVSTAEFLVSGFDGIRAATLTRQPDITGSTVAYTGGINQLADVNYIGVFSTSQAGHLVNGDLVSMNNAQSMVPCVIGAFDGTTGCTLAQYNRPEVNLNVRDSLGLWFSRPSDQTGFLEYWIDHVKVIHIIAANIGITPPGGIRPWCTLASLATMGVGASLSHLNFGNTQVNATGSWSMDIGRHITLWWEP